MLIEETVSAEVRQRRKNGTSKESLIDAHTTGALKLTNAMFQDAVCYYTLMLAGMVKDTMWTEELLEIEEVKRSLKGKLDDAQWAARKKEFVGRAINPLWKERCVGATSVLGRLNQPRYRHAAFREDKREAKTVEEVVKNAFRYQGEERAAGATPKVKPRPQPPVDQKLRETFLRYVLPGCVEAKGAKLKLKSMKTAAGVMTGKLCSPAGDNNLPGTGVYKVLHSTIRRIIDESPSGQHWLRRKSERENVPKGNKSARDTAEQALTAARETLLGDAALIDAATREVVNAAHRRAKENAKEYGQEFKRRLDAEMRSAERMPEETDVALRRRIIIKVRASLDEARESTLESYRRVFREGLGADRLRPHLATIQTELAKVSPLDCHLRRVQEGSKKNQGEDFQVFFRLLWLAGSKEHQNLCPLAATDVLAYAIDREPPKVASATLPYQTIGKDEPLFPYFTNSLAKDEMTPLHPEDQVVWDDFDTPAFKRAAEEFFKYATHTHERQKKVNGLRDFIGCFTGKGRKSDKQPKPKKRKDADVASEPQKPAKPRYAVFGMEGDSRKEKMEQLLQTLGQGRGSGASGYGLRFNTIGGWVYLRPELLKANRKHVKLIERLKKRGVISNGLEERLEDHLEQNLHRCIEKIRSKVGGGFGADDVFKALCDTDNHVLWLDGEQTREWHAPDFVAHYARYTGKLEDLQAIADKEQNWKPEAINFTWPGEEHTGKRELSFRPFDFKCDICTQPEIKLFAPAPDGVGVRIVETNKQPEFPLTLSFRRLKRDRIVLPDGTSWESFWSPPKLSVGESLPPPLAGPIVQPREVEVEPLVSLLDRLPAALAVNGVLAELQKSLGELSQLQKVKKSDRDGGKIDAAQLNVASHIFRQMPDEERTELTKCRRRLIEVKESLKTQKLTKKKAKEDEQKAQQRMRAVLSNGLNRLVNGAARLYEQVKISKPVTQALANDPRQFHHRMQNRRCLEMALGDALRQAKDCFNKNVSLLAPKHPDGAFHFMFAVEVDAEDLKAFQVEPRVPGEKPYRLTKQGETKVAAYLRWPVDLESEREAIKKQKETGEANAAEGDDEDESESGGRSLPAVTELWCNTEAFKQKGFHALFVDLGVRFAGGWSRAWIREANGAIPVTAHLISSGSPDIWCHFYDEGTFRLQGEDAKVWHRPNHGDHSKQDSRFTLQDVPPQVVLHGFVHTDVESQWPDPTTEKQGWRFGRELYGSRGRLASPEEILAVFGTDGLAERLFPHTTRTPLPEEGTDARRFVPALADHLVMRLERRLSRIGFLFTLRWRLEGEKERDPKTGECTLPRQEIQNDGHKRAVVESLAAKELHPDGAEVEDVGWNTALREALADDQTWASVSELLKTKKDRKRDKRRGHERKLEQAIKQGTGWRWKKLADAVHEQLKWLLGQLSDSVGSGLLAQVADYAWPLRDKAWHWQSHRIDSSGKPIPSKLVRVTPKEPRKGKIIGQGGLNMTRIKLLQRFSRCCASLAWHEERFNRGRIPGEPGVEPPPMRKRGEGPKPCDDLLEKIDQLRDQRVEQTAALILAEALGLELQNPADVTIDGLRKWQLKSERDVHGQYQRRELKPAKAKELAVAGDNPLVPQCAMIVVEDLSSYRASLDRSWFENRRLMDWSHRAIIKKLKDMAQVFGVEIVAVNARYSSRYCSKTHVPGVRVAEVRTGFEKEQPWRRWKDEKAKGKPTERATQITKAIEYFQGGCDGSLLIELEGGPLFLAVNGEQPVNADINASRNIGFRAVAHPDLWHFFPVLRTETDEDGNLRIANWRGTLAAKPNDDPARIAKPTVPPREQKSEDAEEADADEDENESAAKPYLFVPGPVGGLFLELPTAEEVFTAKPQPRSRAEFRVAKWKLFWSLVTTACRKRIEEINTAKVSEWRRRRGETPNS